MAATDSCKRAGLRRRHALGEILAAIVVLAGLAGEAACLVKLAQPKRPLSSYMLWMQDNRPRLVRELGDSRGPAVAKLGGARWNALAWHEKAEYQQRAAALKEEYLGELAAFIAKGGVMARAPRRRKPPVRDPSEPRRPKNAYMLFLQENWDRLAGETDGSAAAIISKAAGLEWTTLGEEQKAVYQSRAAEDMAQYDAAMASFVSAGGVPVRTAKKSAKAPRAALAETAGPAPKARRGRATLEKAKAREAQAASSAEAVARQKAAQKAVASIAETAPAAPRKSTRSLAAASKNTKATKREPTASKKTKASKDPDAPRRPMTTYMLWLQDNRAAIAASLPAGHRLPDVAREAGARWRSLPSADRSPYEDLYAHASVEYRRALEEYRAHAKGGRPRAGPAR